METAYAYTAKISEVVKPAEPLPPEQDQTFVCELYANGMLSLKFYGDGKRLVSRISLSLKSASAVEVFSEPEKDYWLMRVNGNQVPLVLPLEEMTKLMNAVDALTDQPSTINNYASA